ncbi:hypothetical protein HY025_05910 [Candidatus Daviesbacteria bacterium]|nr:hypothetical protein [Candidatus Daviesbacteria bacterium]
MANETPPPPEGNNQGRPGGRKIGPISLPSWGKPRPDVDYSGYEQTMRAMRERSARAASPTSFSEAPAQTARPSDEDEKAAELRNLLGSSEVAAYKEAVANGWIPRDPVYEASLGVDFSAAQAAPTAGPDITVREPIIPATEAVTPPMYPPSPADSHPNAGELPVPGAEERASPLVDEMLDDSWGSFGRALDAGRSSTSSEPTQTGAPHELTNEPILVRPMDFGQLKSPRQVAIEDLQEMIQTIKPVSKAKGYPFTLEELGNESSTLDPTERAKGAQAVAVAIAEIIIDGRLETDFPALRELQIYIEPSNWDMVLKKLGIGILFKKEFGDHSLSGSMQSYQEMPGDKAWIQSWSSIIPFLQEKTS